MAEQRLIDATDLIARGNASFGGVSDAILLKKFVNAQPTIDPESLPVVRQLREELDRVKAERNVTQALLAEYSGVIGMERVRYIFGHPLDKALNLLMADREGRCVVIPEGGFADKDGERALKAAMYVCSVENSASTRYTACAIAEKLLRDAGKHT